MERGLDLGCLIALRCESARRQSRSKIFKVKKFFLVPVQLEFRSVLRHSVLGQDVSGAGRRGAESQNMFASCFRTLGKFSAKKIFPTFRPIRVPISQ